MRCRVLCLCAFVLACAIWSVRPSTEAARADEAAGAKRAEQVRKELAPKLVTLKSDKVRLREVLKQLAGQTGIQVEDRRRKEDADDPELKLDLKGVSFWQALDTIAREADLRVALYRGGIALVDGPHVQLPVAYDGLFRTAVRRVTAVHDLETDARFCVATLEIAWEPRFRPLLLESRPQGLLVKDDKGRELTPEDEGSGKVAVDGRTATTVDVRLPAPPRAAAKFSSLKGSFSLVGPSKMLSFEFDTLAKEKAAKEPKQTKEGVTVRLSNLDLADDHWTVEVTLDYPADGPKFESFQSWVANNECLLKRADGKGEFPCNGGWSTVSLGSNKAVLEYHFLDGTVKQVENGKAKTVKLVRGKPEDWKVVYRTPGPMAEVTAAFEFKGVPLP